LITNALKHTQDGLLKVNIKRRYVTEFNSYQDIYLQHIGSEILPNQEYLLVEIVDNGAGIPEHELNYVFNQIRPEKEEVS